MDWTSLLPEIAKILGGGVGGTAIGYYAQKNAAKSEAVKDLQLLKTEYKEFAEFTKRELDQSRQERVDCQAENAGLKKEIADLHVEVNEMKITIHNAIGTPKDKRK